jgi:hypothetical protein
VIIGAVGWAAVAGPLGGDIGDITPLYLGEVMSIWAFGVSWLLKGRDIWRALNVLPPGPRQVAERTAVPAGESGPQAR